MRIISLPSNFSKLDDKKKFDIMMKLWLKNHNSGYLEQIAKEDIEFIEDMFESAKEEDDDSSNLPATLVLTLMNNFSSWYAGEVFIEGDQIYEEELNEVELRKLFPKGQFDDYLNGITFLVQMLPNAYGYAAKQIQNALLKKFVNTPTLKKWLKDTQMLTPNEIPLDPHIDAEFVL